MKTTIAVKNVMVCGCNNSIHKGLGAVAGVFGVRVEPEKNRIVVEHTDETDRQALEARLREMGYVPEESEAGNYENCNQK